MTNTEQQPTRTVLTPNRVVVTTISGIIIGEGSDACAAWSDAYTTPAGAYRPGFYDDHFALTYNPVRYRAVRGKRLAKI